MTQKFETKYPAVLKLRIDWSELDLFGHVNNVMFMKYIQAARLNYWEQVGIYEYFLKTRIGPMLADVHCSFRKPLHYPGEIMIRSGMRFIGTTSFSFSHRIYDPAGELAAEAEDVMVMFDFNKDEKVAFPEEFRRKVEELEHGALD